MPALAASSVVAVVDVSRDARIVAVNALAAALLGAGGSTPLEGRALAGLLARGRDATSLVPGAPGTVRRDVEVRLAGAGGREVVLRGDVLTLPGAGDGPVARGVFVDCTELENLQRSLQRSARLEALASLTSGIAHDFNNLLTVLIGNLSLMAEELRDRPKTFARLKSSRDAAMRGSDLIAQLRGFAGSEGLETSVVDPSESVRKVVPLLGSVLGKRVQLKTNLDSGAGPVEANLAQLESAIVNLAVNARDAIDGHGTVTVSSSPVQLAGRQASRRGLAPGSYVEIRVADDGPGIPEELRERVFEPFFSTKRDRGGTGLGLSMVRLFARQLGGSAEIVSEAGRGTAVSLLLPTTAQACTSGTHTMPLATLPTGTEHVAVLAADAGLAATVSQILDVLGYMVTVCGDRAELEHVVARGAPDLVIVDGPADAACSGPRAILLADSGGTDAVPGRGAVLVKPFSLADLAAAVRETLDG